MVKIPKKLPDYKSRPCPQNPQHKWQLQALNRIYAKASLNLQSPILQLIANICSVSKILIFPCKF